MSGFNSIINQERPIRILTTLLQNGTLPHALLFTGPEGVGKQAAAIALAMACNCQSGKSKLKPVYHEFQGIGSPRVEANDFAESSCGTCKPCKKIESGIHPDVIQIKPSGVFIKISQIRELSHTLAMKPYEATIRVVIISDAQTMNAAASNALLKVLEEPPDRTILVLVATQKADLLPTIVSRCQLIRFKALSKETLTSLLNKKYGVGAKDASIIAILANGSLSRALAMYQKNWVDRRNWLLNEIDSLSLQPIGRLVALAEKLSKDKDTLADTLEVIKYWFRDIIIGKYDPEKIINQDFINKIGMASQKMNVTSVISKLDAIQRTQNNISANTNLRLTLETLLMKLAQS